MVARLRDTLARAAVPLAEVTELVCAELNVEVCSVYVLRPGELLELAATKGLNPRAVGRTKLRVGEGIVGLSAALGQVLNLADAQNHPAFVYRSETGEEPYAALMAVPIRRAGRVRGVLTVQSLLPRRFDDDEVEALETVAMLLAEAINAAGAAEAIKTEAADSLPRLFGGTVLVGGVAVGPVHLHGLRAGPTRMLADDIDQELARLADAVGQMNRGLDALIASGLPRKDAASRDVLEAFRLIAADNGWVTRAAEAVRTGLSAEAAIQRVTNQVRDRMRGITDPYLRERLADLDDMAGRVLAVLSGETPVSEALPGSIVIARRLGPADLLDLHAHGIAGVVVEEASAAGHAAILARALGIAMLGGISGVIEAAEQGVIAILDAEEGQLVLRPETDVLATYERIIETRAAQRIGWAALRGVPTVSRDGTPLRLMLNVGLPIELGHLDETGADGIGLFRTEIAMLARGAVADVDAQASLYSRVLDAAGDRPVLFRTLDLGSDKMLPGTVSDEDNPAMGWRSLRIGLDRPAFLRRQLRALLRGGAGRSLSIMFPMVASIAEFRAARKLLDLELRAMDKPLAALSVGAMLEVPALLWQLPVLYAEADFISVGSNDLMQFLFAADRGSPGISGRYDILSSPALAVLDQIVAGAAATRCGLSLCGEAAGRPIEALALAAIGFRSLSMSASAIAPVKALLLEADLRETRAMLDLLRQSMANEPSLRPRFEMWARERALPV